MFCFCLMVLSNLFHCYFHVEPRFDCPLPNILSPKYANLPFFKFIISYIYIYIYKQAFMWQLIYYILHAINFNHILKRVDLNKKIINFIIRNENTFVPLEFIILPLIFRKCFKSAFSIEIFYGIKIEA